MTDSSKLNDEEWNRLQDITERFERDCAEAFPRDPALYLPAVGDPLREHVLDEILLIDLELHWRKGKGNRVEEYFDRFPELRQRENRLLQLIEEEYRIRCQFGDRPSADEFLSRFPEYRGVLTGRLRPDGRGEFHTMDSAIEIPMASMGNLTKVRRIGEGGFGEVWECRAPGGVPVAVKRLFATVSPKFIEREKQSLDLICSGKFRHPFLLQVFGWWIQENRLHIVMELADESLDDRLKQAKSQGRSGLDADETLRRIIRDAGEALDFLNFKCHVLHRDVKPANMLLMNDRLKLCDFGLSRMTENLQSSAGQTLGAGTPVFIAPEIVQGFQAMESDQYSLAVSYCMLRTGRPLFRGTVKEIREQHVHAKPPLEETILSSGEQRVLAKALRKEPKERFRSSSEFVGALLASLDPASARGVTPASTPVGDRPLPSSTLAGPTLEPSVKGPAPSPLATEPSEFVPLRRQHVDRHALAVTAAEPPMEDPSPRGLPLWLRVALIAAVFVLGIVIGGMVFSGGND
jgi:serine/threonine protein kinase